MIPMRCTDCDARWVALPDSATIKADHASYHVDLDALACPRCGRQGIADQDTLDAHSRHPQAVASTPSRRAA